MEAYEQELQESLEGQGYRFKRRDKKTPSHVTKTGVAKGEVLQWGDAEGAMTKKQKKNRKGKERKRRRHETKSQTPGATGFLEQAEQSRVVVEEPAERTQERVPKKRTVFGVSHSSLAWIVTQLCLGKFITQICMSMFVFSRS